MLLEELPCNISLASIMYLLSNCHGKDNILLRVFGCLEMVAIISVWLVL